MRYLVTCLIAAFLASAPLHAELTPDQQRTARACIERFTSKMFKERQEAVDELVRMGPDVVPLIRKTLDGAEDNEVKLRCEMVLKGIRETYVVGPDDRLINVGASRCTASFKKRPLSEVLQTLARSTGNTPMKLQSTTMAKIPVTVEIEDKPYWQAIDEVRKSAGLIYSYDYSTRGFQLSRGKPEPDVGAYAGPAMVKMYSINRSVSVFNGAESRSLGLTCACLWEDRLPVICGGVVLTQLRTEGGVDLAVSSRRIEHGLWDSTNALQRASIPNPPLIRGETVDLTGCVRLEIAVGRREAKIDNVFGKGEKTIEVDGLSVAVTEAESSNREIRLVVKGTAKDDYPSLRPLCEDYGVFLCDPSGKRILPKTKLRRAYSGKVSGDLIFIVNRTPGTWSLVLVYPERVETREYPFELKEVKLP